ncbi:MAG: P-loop NTPase fold protein [Prolixibacteraceae bacterium]|jgi:hypothetical protein
MTDDKPLVIPIDSIERDFEDFLSPDSNKRIIFSGPFGIGKTYFLDKFFKNRKPKYLPIFLRPVNYSLLSNEDVFKLIKYDILLQLINTNGFEIENEFNFSDLDYANFFIGENRFLILQNLLKLIPKIQSTVDGIENFSKLIDAFRKGKKEINENPDLKMLFEFQHETQENFLLEYDHVSQFIAEKLDEISDANKTEGQLKKVLIIDDLDRLDPEHIFRLFNVFSAHFDHVNYYSNEEEIKNNKFGFDKIIFVCDIENIRKIFSHKYGDGVDFSGYIDKFYSSQIYHFNKDKSVQKYINDIFKSYESTYPQKGGTHSQILSIVKSIFRDLIEAKCVNHRIIQNITKRKIRFREPYSISFWSPSYVRNYEFVFIQVLDFLYDIFGKNYKTLNDAIKKASELKRNSANKHINNHMIYMLPLLTLDVLEGNAEHTWRHPQYSESIFYQIEQGMDDVYSAKIKNEEIKWLKYLNYYSLLLLVVENLKNIGVFDFEPE